MSQTPFVAFSSADSLEGEMPKFDLASAYCGFSATAIVSHPTYSIVAESYRATC
jgi:hypothetical protein